MTPVPDCGETSYTGSGKLTVHGSATWTTGTMSGSGRTILDTTSSLFITNPTAIYLDQRTLENGGTIYWTGTGDLDASTGAVITNRPGALFNV